MRFWLENLLLLALAKIIQVSSNQIPAIVTTTSSSAINNEEVSTSLVMPDIVNQTQTDHRIITTTDSPSSNSHLEDHILKIITYVTIGLLSSCLCLGYVYYMQKRYNRPYYNRYDRIPA